MNQRALWSIIGAVAAAQLALVLVTWSVVGSAPTVRGPASTPLPSVTPGPTPPSLSVQRLAEVVSGVALRSMTTSNHAALAELVRHASLWPEVVYVSVEDGGGKIIAHTDATRIGQVWSPPTAREPYQEALAPIETSDTGGKPPSLAGLVRLGVVAEPLATAATPSSRGRLPIVAMLLVAALSAIPVGFGLVKLVGAAGPAAEPPVRDLRGVQSLKQAQDALAHWMREADLVRAQGAGQREELQRLRAEIARGASHLAQATAESEQLLTERAHWLTERDLLSVELTERDRELERLQAALEERGSDADSVRVLLETEIADLREEVRQAHTALANRPAACRELLDREIRLQQHRAIAYIAHAIRGSLTSVLGFSRLLQRDIAAPLTEYQRASVQHIYESGAHLLRIVNDLSELTQLEAVAVEARDEIVDVAALVREVAASGATVLTREPETIIVEAPPPLPPVRGNNRRLTQLLLALMQSPARVPEGPVELSARADDEAVSLVVTHHGTSLSAPDLPSLFDPFAPIDATSTLQDDGRRLRLALARALATAIGGSIEADTQAGPGLTFTVRIPVAADLPAVA